MSANKTIATTQAVADFINQLPQEQKRKDCLALINLVAEITQTEPKMWGSSIIGFGSHHYRYDSGREGESPNFGFSPRASSIALYLSANLPNREALLEQLGKHKTEKACVHIKTLADVSLEVLTELIRNHLTHIQQLYPSQT